MSERASRVQHFPISFFAMVMGLAGLTLAWEKGAVVLALAVRPTPYLLALTALVFAGLLLAYAGKWLRYPQAALAELRHPIRLSFAPTLSISLILLGTASLHLAPALSHGLWLLGSGLHLLFTLYVMGAWIHQEHFEIQHMNPAWFIPVVGNILVPIAGMAHGYPELSWFCFSIGLLFWLVLLTIFFNRVIFHHPLPERLMPTLFILIAPPAVGFVSYVALSGAVDAFARVLYYAGLFLTVLLLSQLRYFLRLRFFLSWWAYSFPLAAITVASFVMAQRVGGAVFEGIALALLALLSGVVALLLVLTARAALAGRICVEEG